MPRNNNQLAALSAVSSSPRSPASQQQQQAVSAMHAGFNSYSGQLAVTDAAAAATASANGQWTDGERLRLAFGLSYMKTIFDHFSLLSLQMINFISTTSTISSSITTSNDSCNSNNNNNSSSSNSSNNNKPPRLLLPTITFLPSPPLPMVLMSKVIFSSIMGAVALAAL